MLCSTKFGITKPDKLVNVPLLRPQTVAYRTIRYLMLLIGYRHFMSQSRTGECRIEKVLTDKREPRLTEAFSLHTRAPLGGYNPRPDYARTPSEAYR